MWKISLQEYIKGQLVSIQCTDIIEVKIRMKKSEPTKHAIQLFYQLYTPISRKKGSKVEWVFSKSVGESSVCYGNWMKSSAKVSASHQFLWEFDEGFSKSVDKSSVFMGIGWSQCWINRWAGAQLSLQTFAFIITALLSLSSNFKSFSFRKMTGTQFHQRI